jgi:putative membrane protein
MLNFLSPFLVTWAITALSLWVASHIFKGIQFESPGSIIIAALLLGFANAIVRPLLIILTLPLTVLTLGLFLLVINALMILLVSALMRGFKVSGFWTALFASIFISILSFAISAMIGNSGPPETRIQMPVEGKWL